MLKVFVFCSLFAVSLAGVVYEKDGLEAETDHHHKIDHEHATSHQSFKIHHFHAVPVYVKHEDQHYLKNPIEVGGIKHKLKVLHPKTEPHHSHGLTLENHTEGKDFIIHGYDHYDGSHQYETVENPQELDSGSVGGASGGQDNSRHQFQDITVHHGYGSVE